MAKKNSHADDEQELERMEFFPKSRRKLQLRQWHPNRTAAGEFRLRMDFSMPLFGDNLKRLPHQVDAAYTSVATLANGITSSEVEASIDPLTIECFATDTSSKRAVAPFPAAELRNLYVRRPKMQSKKDPTEVELRFVTTIPVTDDQLLWARKHLRQFFFAEFTATQASIDTKPAKAKPENKQTSFNTEDFPEPPEPKKRGKDAAAGAD